MSYYDTELADRAVAALWRWHKRSGYSEWHWQQPNRYETQTTKEGTRRIVEVRNCNGLLAKYVELPSGRLRRLQ